MTINTKYNIGDKVWTIESNGVFHTTIEEITTESNKYFLALDRQSNCVGSSIFYKLNGVSNLKKENVLGDLFATKEELLEYLTKSARTDFSVHEKNCG